MINDISKTVRDKMTDLMFSMNTAMSGSPAVCKLFGENEWSRKTFFSQAGYCIGFYGNAARFLSDIRPLGSNTVRIGDTEISGVFIIKESVERTIQDLFTNK